MKEISSTRGYYHMSVNGQYVNIHANANNPNERQYLCDFDTEKVALLVANNGGDAKLREDLAHLAKGHMELKAALEAFQKETAKRLDVGDGVARDAARDAYKMVQELRKELDEMPGGYRNSQDIKRLSKEVDHLKQSNEQRKKDIVHVTNLIEEFRSKCDAAVGYAKSAERKANGLIIADSIDDRALEISKANHRIDELEKLLQNGNRVTVHSRLYDLEEKVTKQGELVLRLEECCKNTVYSGKALEEKVNSMQRQYQETLNYIRGFNADLTPRVKAALQNILKGM